jgi:hypothetical protein
MRRKQLGNSLRSVAGITAEAASSALSRMGIDPKIRAESLAPGELAALMRSVLPQP